MKVIASMTGTVMTRYPTIKHYPRIFLLGFALIAALCTSACKHYQWGNPCVVSMPFRTLYVEPVINNSYGPQIENLISSQVIQLFHQSGIETVACADQAQASLEIVIDDYDLSTATTLALDTGVASSFYVSLKGHITLKDNCNCCLYFENRAVESTINIVSDKGTEEALYHDMPSLTRQLANNIRNIVTGTW